MGCYGYERNTTPAIDALAKRSTVFTRTVTPTPSSNMTLFKRLAGLECTDLRSLLQEAQSHFAGSRKPGSAYSAWQQRLVHGRGSLAFHAYLQKRPSFACMADGFDDYNIERGDDELNASQVTDYGLRLVDKANKRLKQKFFIFLHYMDPHAGYSHHPEFDFGTDPLDRYDSEIAYVDSQVKRLLSGLKARGLEKNTAIVFFADHGESFGEHNKRNARDSPL